MAAVQAPGTPAPAETPAQAVETGDPIADALASYTPEPDESEAGSAEEPVETEPETPAEPQTEEPPKPEPGAKRKRSEVEAELFNEQALGTKDGVEKAAGYLRKRQSKLDGISVRLDERAAELSEAKRVLDEQYQAAQAELEQDRRRAQAVRELDRTLSEGSVEEMLDALGRIRNKSGREVWDEMSRAVISGRVKGAQQLSPEVAALQREITALRGEIAEREARAREGTERAEEEQLAANVRQLEEQVTAAARDATKYPELARYTALGLGENIVAEVVRIKTEARRAGRPLDNAAALSQIEAELKRLPAGASPASPAGATPASPAAASAVDVPVTGIAPSQTRSAGVVREKTQAELDADLARDTAFLSSLLGMNVG